MIFEYKQIDTSPNIQHAIYKDKLLSVGTSNGYFSGSITIGNSNYGLEVRDGLISIVQNGMCVGSIKEKLLPPKEKKWFASGIQYYEYILHGRTTFVYFIGFSKRDQQYYQFAENQQTIAMIQKPTKVVNRLDRYICYLQDEELVERVAIWCLFLQSSAYYPFMIAGEGNVTTNKSYISTKSERENFDPTFIPRIKAMEGI